MKAILSSLLVLSLFFLAAPVFADASSAPLAVADGCGVDLAQILAAKEAPLCSSKPGDLIGSPQLAPLDLATAPHCCSTAEVDACRNLCKQQGPGCKGVIGCRAGECVCTCSCP